MNKKLKVIKNVLIVNVVLMFVVGIFYIFRVIDNEPFLYEGRQVVLATGMQIKMIMAILVSLVTIICPLRLMIKFTGNIRKFKVFHKDNIKIMERVAIYLGLYGFLSLIGVTINTEGSASVTRAIITESAIGELDISKFGINLSLEVFAIISVVSIIIAMIEIIKNGIEIQQENDLTV